MGANSNLPSKRKKVGIAVTKVNRRERDYRVREKLSTGQTLELMFKCLEEHKGTLYYNISLSIYSKRKHADKNEDEKKITGKNPLETVLVGRRVFSDVEELVISECMAQGFNVVFEVFWTENRRRNAYYRVLSKYGYRYGIRGNVKCLEKIVLYNE